MNASINRILFALLILTSTALMSIELDAAKNSLPAMGKLDYKLTETTLLTQNPFLISPYYGDHPITSHFDHQYPTYDDEDDFTRYDGAYWGENTNITECLSVISPGPFGNCYDGHNGVDFHHAYEPVLAAADGYVSEVRWKEDQGNAFGYGLYIIIDHDIEGNQYQTRYAHLTTANVLERDWVNQGEIIGTSGGTGGFEPHLHFDVGYYTGPTYKFLPIDPFGWSGTGNDPWDEYPFGGPTSWCMWEDGQWASYCDSGHPGLPIPQPLRGKPVDYINTPDNSNGFSKGDGGPWNNPCTGACLEWYGSSTYHTLANGLEITQVFFCNFSGNLQEMVRN